MTHDPNYKTALRGLDSAEAVADALEALPIRIHRIANQTLGLMQSDPLLAMRAMAWVIGAGVRPSGFVPADGTEREEWLRMHNNATYLAVHVGPPEERRAVVEKALSVATENIAIYHNAACVWCVLGEADRALDAIREGVAQGYDDATIASIRTDTDLALIADTDAFRDALEGRGEIRLPAWAAEFTHAEYTQFREAVRTCLHAPDMSSFREGFVTDGETTIPLVELAARCVGKPALEVTHIVLHAMQPYV